MYLRISALIVLAIAVVSLLIAYGVGFGETPAHTGSLGGSIRSHPDFAYSQTISSMTVGSNIENEDRLCSS